MGPGCIIMLTTALIIANTTFRYAISLRVVSVRRKQPRKCRVAGGLSRRWFINRNHREMHAHDSRSFVLWLLVIECRHFYHTIMDWSFDGRRASDLSESSSSWSLTRLMPPSSDGIDLWSLSHLDFLEPANVIGKETGSDAWLHRAIVIHYGHLNNL